MRVVGVRHGLKLGNLVFLRLIPMQPNFAGNVIELLGRDRLQRLPFAGQFLGDLDDLFGHHFMSLFGSAEEREVWSSGDPFVAVGIQSDANQESFRFRFRRQSPHAQA